MPIVTSCQELPTLLKNGEILNCTHRILCKIDYPSPVLRGFQGGCSDRKRYYYQIVMHYDLPDRLRDYGRVAKVDLQTGEVVRWSENLYLDHANDMTYHPGTHRILVCHNKPRYQHLSYLDADTLELVDQTDLPFPFYAIEYNEKRDQYLIGLSGTREFRFLNADFSPTDDRIFRTAPLTDRCVKQGICADDELLYFILWDGRHKAEPDFQNRIAVYDWNGDFRGLLHFNVGVQEPESISIVSGQIHAVCGRSHPIIYRFTPET
ncbi:MAG: hypothetical protein E7585_05190 [Ruminococcaceae bacterium]|nr:hypothetical protein [Oscillospiraceae bacterium]